MISTMSGNVPLSLWRTSTLIDLEQMQSNLHGDLVVRCSLRETNLRTWILIRRGLRPIQSLHFGILVMFHVLIIFGNHLATWAWARKSLLDFDFDFMVIVYILLELGRITAQNREMTQNHTFWWVIRSWRMWLKIFYGYHILKLYHHTDAACTLLNL